MAWDINRVILVGRLTNDVDFRYTPSQTAIAKFGLAVGGRPNQDGTPSTSFFNIVVWGKAAESCNSYLSKGKQVAIDGRLQQRSWQAQDGSKRSTVEIVAERVEFLGSNSGGQRSQNTNPQPQRQDSWNQPTGNRQSGSYSNQQASDQVSPDTLTGDAGFNANEPMSGDDFATDDDVPF